MKKECLEFLCCSDCVQALEMKSTDSAGERSKTGSLTYGKCKTELLIRNFIPWLVNESAYADSFGPQWNAFSTSQLDIDRLQESALRFKNEIG